MKVSKIIQKNKGINREFTKLVGKAIAYSAVSLVLLGATLLFFPNVIAEIITGLGAVLFGASAYFKINEVNGWTCLHSISHE